MSLMQPPAEMKVTIREFQPEDASCVEFVVLSVLQEWGFLPSAKDQQELESLQSQNPFDALFVAEDLDLGVVGCAGVVRIDETVCELRKIYLLQRFRGRTIGKKLLDACIEEAKKHRYSKMRIELSAPMALYLTFFHRNGFTLSEGEKPVNPAAETVYYKDL